MRNCGILPRVSVVIKVTDQLAADEEFRAYIEENIDLEWETMNVPEEKLPQWIKDRKD